MLSASWNEEFDDNISLPAFRAAMLVVVKSGVTHNKKIRLVRVLEELLLLIAELHSDEAQAQFFWTA